MLLQADIDIIIYAEKYTEVVLGSSWKSIFKAVLNSTNGMLLLAAETLLSYLISVSKVFCYTGAYITVFKIDIFLRTACRLT